MYLAKIVVTIRKTILDPQGKAIHHALQSLGMAAVHDVRMGKFIEMQVNSGEQEEAERITQDACEKLLANPVMENYTFSLEKIS